MHTCEYIPQTWAKKCFLVTTFILWPLFCFILTFLTMISIYVPPSHAYIKFCMVGVKDCLWGLSEQKAGKRSRCSLYFGRFFFILISPILLALLIVIFFSSIFIAVMLSPFLFAFYLTVGFIRYICLFCD